MAEISEPIANTMLLSILGLIVATFMLVLKLDDWRRERERQRRERLLDVVLNARARRGRGD